MVSAAGMVGITLTTMIAMSILMTLVLGGAVFALWKDPDTG